MNLFRKLCPLLVLLWAGTLFGQTLTVTLNPIAQVPVGGAFTVSGFVSHDPATPTIPGGTPVNITIQVFDPSGNAILVAPTIPFTGGFGAGAVFNFNQSFTMPWSEDDKWNAAANWSASVSASSSVSALAQGTQNFTLLIADLTILANQPTTAVPGESIDLTGTIRNLANVQAEPGLFFRVQASIPGSTQSIVFPPTNSWVPGTPWPISETSDNNFVIPNFVIPADTPAGPLDITLTVDDPAGNELVHEQDDVANNTVTHTINITAGAANLQPSSDFLINGDIAGTFQGGDLVKINVTLRNVGTGTVQPGDAFMYQVFLSRNDDSASAAPPGSAGEDFILREIDLGGGGLGLGLRPNETITLDWIQMLPDNFEGDFYVNSRMNNVTNTLNLKKTPTLSLRSENAVSISSESLGAPPTHHHSRPSTTLDGMMIAHGSLSNGVNEILLINKNSGTPTTVTTPTTGGLPNGSSYAPVLSSNGKFVVFHSHASNLVPNDTNGHVDVFRYEVFNSRLTRLSVGSNGEEGNGGSFYPVISEDGTKVAFESHASNLDSSTPTSGKQIFLWTESNDTSSGTGTVTAISNGNGDSFDASISDDGQRMVFTTFSDNLVTGETDSNKNSDVVLWEGGQFYFAGRSEDGFLPAEGDTKEGVISPNGEVVSFVSSARNMVSGKGISHIHIADVGVGYPAGSTVLITDSNGSGASVTISSRNQYGEILAFSIDNPGKNYVAPVLSVLVPPGSTQPDRNVSATPLLVNPDGDVFKISTTQIKANGKSERLSESQPLNGDPGSETGGNMGSREPTISQNGTAVAYSTKASNLLDLNITSTNKDTFANLPFRVSTAQAVLHWGLGSIQITNPGTGYLGTGTLVIDDLSGGGSGAVATYHVLANGEVGEITMISAGSGYDLNQTIVSIQNDPTGSGFTATALGVTPTGLAANRQGGATIHRIEVIDPGIGYPPQLNQLLQSPEIIIDGDGADLDGDGKPDARFNPDRLYSGANGEIYIEQQIDLGIKQRASLLGSTLTISDVNKTLTLNFASAPNAAFTLGVDFRDLASLVPNQTDSGLRDDIITAINNFWGSPTDLLNGPVIENNGTADGNFTLRALNGMMQTDNRSSLQISYRSNMLVGGSGYTRATPSITPAPAIIGFSEIETGTSTITLPNGRPVMNYQEDMRTDDVYVFDQSTHRNRRITLNKFGYPTNYLLDTNFPSHRYPAISGDARHVFFSSDASGLGGLIFDFSNQTSLDPAGSRSIYSVDLKSNQLPKNNDDYTITISSNILTATNATTFLSRPFPVMVKASAKKGSLANVRLYADGTLVGNNPVGVQGTRDHETFFSWTPSRQGTFELVVSVVNNIGEEIFSSPTFVEVISPTVNTATGTLTIRPTGAANQTTEGSSLLASVEYTGSNGKQALVGSVSFYLNDQLIETQTDPPFSTVFSPPAYNGAASLTRWSLSAVAKDLNGTAFVTSRFGNIQGSSVLPTLTLAPINTLAGLADKEVFDKQRVTIEASAHGDSDALALVQTVSFFGNGIVLDGNVVGVPITTASGQITSVEYQINWDVDFSRFAKPDGTVEIIALGEMTPVGGFTPVFVTAPFFIKVSPPTPWLDEKSTALSLFSDLSESNMSTRQVESLLQTINSGSAGSLETWVNELSEVASFQQKLDVIAVRHICMGEWHESFLDLETDFTTYIPNGTTATPTWLKNYADAVLNSDQYIAKYGVVPLLVGTFFEKDMYDFDLNRRQFAEQCLTNKYAMAPSFQQMFQGSKRMLYFWDSGSGGNYWELHPQVQAQQGGGQGGPAVVVPVFSNPRLDNTAPTNYAAGECAVELVTQLALEVPLDNLQYILYTEPIRDKLYKIATFVQLLWRENADPVSDSDIKRLAAMSSTDAIKEILNDYRYTSRFNLIWQDSAVVDSNTPSWKKEDWFGYFWDKHFPWVYHETLGWIYLAGVSPTQFWFHHDTLGWLWTGAAHYPNVYSNTENGWIYFSQTQKAYFSHTTNTWKAF